MRRKVLVIAYYFPPMGLSGVQRTLKFVKYLPQFGWDPIVLTYEPSSYYAFDESLEDEIPDSAVIYRAAKANKAKVKKIKKFPNYLTHKFGQMALQTIFIPDSKIWWKKYALQKAKEIIEENQIDVIFSTAPPFTDFLIAEELSQIYDLPYLVDYRDQWTGNEFHYNLTPYHSLRNTNLERQILTRCDKSIVITREAKEQLIKRYGFLNYNDVVIIPHGYDPEDFPVSKSKDNKDKLVFTHSGVFQDNRTPLYFFKALADIKKKKPQIYSKIEAKFIGILRPEHIKLSKRFGVDDCVNHLGYIKHKEAVRELVQSDVLWLMVKDKVRTPGKLYEYFGAEKPLLICAPDGPMRSLALSTNAAIGVDPEDSRAITTAILQYFELWQSGDLPKPDKKVVNQFDRRHLAELLAKELSMAGPNE